MCVCCCCVLQTEHVTKTVIHFSPVINICASHPHPGPYSDRRNTGHWHRDCHQVKSPAHSAVSQGNWQVFQCSSLTHGPAQGPSWCQGRLMSFTDNNNNVLKCSKFNNCLFSVNIKKEFCLRCIGDIWSGLCRLLHCVGQQS